MDFTATEYSGQGSFTVKEGTIDKLLFLLKPIGIYPKQVSMIISIETRITCDFAGEGGGRNPYPHSGSAHVAAAMLNSKGASIAELHPFHLGYRRLIAGR